MNTDFTIETKGYTKGTWEEILELQAGCESSADEDEEDEKEQDYIQLDGFSSEKKSKHGFEPKNKFTLDNTYLVMNYTEKGNKRKVDKSLIDRLLKQSTMKAGLEKEHALPLRKSKRAQKKERKAIREKTKGKDWYHLPATEVTEELKNDLDILKMRSALDSKHMYKKNNISNVTPKYFQVGKVVEGPADFYSGRIPKSQRKRTLVDELLADSKFKAYQKKRYKEILDVNRHKKPRKQIVGKKKATKKYEVSWD